MDCARCGASASETQAKDRSKERSKDRLKDRSFERADGGGGRVGTLVRGSTPIVGYRLKSSSITTITAHLGSQLLMLRRPCSMA
jgi:hypothetical protein